MKEYELINKIFSDIVKSESKIKDIKFLQKAPKHIVDIERKKYEGSYDKLLKITKIDIEKFIWMVEWYRESICEYEKYSNEWFSFVYENKTSYVEYKDCYNWLILKFGSIPLFIKRD